MKKGYEVLIIIAILTVIAVSVSILGGTNSEYELFAEPDSVASLFSLEEYEKNRPKLETLTHIPCGISCPKCGTELLEDCTTVLTSYPPQYYIHCPNCKWSGTKH
jgi:hypothetical protein